MADYSIAQLKAALADAGFQGLALDVMAAISLAEDTAQSLVAINTEGNSPPSRDRGPFQINDHYHPEVSDQCAEDLTCSAQAAYRISNGGSDFSPWSTYKSGAYLQHLSAVQGVAPDPNGAPSSGVLTGLPGAGIIGGAASSVFGPLIDAVGKSLLGAVFVAGGVGLVVAGLWSFTAPVRRKASQAVQLAPVSPTPSSSAAEGGAAGDVALAGAAL